MTARMRVPNPPCGRFRDLGSAGNGNQSCASEILLRGRSRSSLGNTPGTVRYWRYPMSTPSTGPGSQWTRRQNTLTKKKCKVCSGECVNCPHTDSRAESKAAPERPSLRKAPGNGRSPSRAAARAGKPGSRQGSLPPGTTAKKPPLASSTFSPEPDAD